MSSRLCRDELILQGTKTKTGNTNTLLTPLQRLHIWWYLVVIAIYIGRVAYFVYCAILFT